MDIGPPELIIILIIVVLLFGGSRLAGLGKSAGQALREFKEETADASRDQAAPQNLSATPDGSLPPVASQDLPWPPASQGPVSPPASQGPVSPASPDLSVPQPGSQGFPVPPAGSHSISADPTAPSPEAPFGQQQTR